MSTEPVEQTTAERVAELERRRAEALAMGGPERVERHRASGRLTARERLDLLVDPGSFFEIGLLADAQFRRDEPAAADAVVGGFARIDGRKVCVLAVDATVMAGTTGQVNMLKQNRLAAFAGRKGLPLLCLSDNDGGRIPDVMGWRFSGLPFDFATFVQAPPGYPEIPRLVAVVGASFGDSALHASMGHFVVMTQEAAIALVGPPVVASAIGEELTPEELGGPRVSTESSGYAHAAVEDDPAAIAALKRALSYLPDHAGAPAPVAPPADPSREPEQLLTLVPADPRRGYDMRKVLEAIFDAGSLFPWKERYGASLYTAFARLDGQAVGVLASQPLHRAGVLDVPALAKLAQFADLCDTFNLPLVFFQDVPGLMVGSEAERGGILAGYERVVARLARATVPKVVVVVRKAYGGGHFALGGRPTHPDLLLAWPSAELGFMAPETGVRTVYKRRLEEILAQEGEEAHAALVAELQSEWAHESEPWEAAKHLFVDDVIDPRRTREALIAGIEFSWGNGASRRAHGRGRLMPAGPLAHICFLVRDLEAAIADWKAILAELDPAQLEQPIVMVERWEAGDDVMSSATFVNPAGSEIQLLCPLNDGPLARRLAKHGEHVHHVCFTSPDLPGAVARLAEKGIELTGTELQNDPALPWQHWTFITKASSHGALVELAYPYRPVDGVWEPGEGAPTTPS